MRRGVGAQQHLVGLHLWKRHTPSRSSHTENSMRQSCWMPVHQMHNAPIFKRLIKIEVSSTPTTVPGVSEPTHASPPPGPPTRSRLEEQLTGVLQPHDQRLSQSADELQTEPREGPCGTSHTTSVHSAEADWVTEQCSGNTTKTLLNFCLSPPAALSFPCYLIWCVLCFPSLPSFHESEPAERVTQTQQLLRPSLA